MEAGSEGDELEEASMSGSRCSVPACVESRQNDCINCSCACQQPTVSRHAYAQACQAQARAR